MGKENALLYAGIGFATIRGCLQVLPSCRKWMLMAVGKVTETLEVRVHCKNHAVVDIQEKILLSTS